MNKKDYKAIAEIIKKEYHHSREYSSDKLLNDSHNRIINKLADHFEKEDNQFNEGIKYRAFNREQFLEECGVE